MNNVTRVAIEMLSPFVDDVVNGQEELTYGHETFSDLEESLYDILANDLNPRNQYEQMWQAAVDDVHWGQVALHYAKDFGLE